MINTGNQPTLGDLAQAVFHGGEIIEHAFRNRTNMTIETKEDESQVTSADLAAQACMVKFLHARYPNLYIVSEEGVFGDPDENPLYMDPLDGTQAFINDLPTSICMLVSMRGNDPFRTAIRSPFTRASYAAEKNLGAWCNGNRICVRDDVRESPRIGFSAWPKRNGKNSMLVENAFGILTELDAIGCELVSPMAQGFLGLLVASGSIEGTFYPGSGRHDAAPLSLLVREAGGIMTDLDGNDFDFSKEKVPGYIAACNEDVYRMLFETIAPYRRR